MSEAVDVQLDKVLFVDDEESILRSLNRLFMDEEFLVLTANSGEKGLTVLRETGGVGVIVSDQRMPGMSGVEFLSRSRERAPDALRIVLTGYADINATVEAINKGGAYRYITKPWNDEDLLQTIRDAVRQYRLMLENRRLNVLVQKQNEELQEWNTNLKGRVLEQTATIRKQNEDLSAKNERIGENFRKVLEAFSRLVELCSARLKSHAKNVAELSVNVARELNLPEKDIETIHAAALLHDIGKIGIPEAILEKSLIELTESERLIYLQHAVRGQSAIDVVEDLRAAGLLIRHHHERYDGKGFPDGLTGEAIPIGARIIAFADYLDHEFGNQRGGVTVDVVFGKISLHLGFLLDPSLVGHFKRFARYHYFSHPTRPEGGTHQGSMELELPPGKLTEGLIVSRDVFSGTGLLLMRSGTVLDDAKIVSLRRYYQIDPPANGVFVINVTGMVM
ncbi:HD domain-containing phosphohydrolase [Geobacter argillaceus]|uniref:Response regulator receiver modulated metal dependent phosphohydrolase n=1 Tax=Geobacter argillaceus TaxID=345631 RepID=A0A562VNH8_9BACT|nr:HD domain-containing phosphohydrolase [Geobacter argillaceus]TWJ19455.1 response regulator receiver modulated metal dependent phosphohydrolase [Geobacter argillaceus]